MTTVDRLKPQPKADIQLVQRTLNLKKTLTLAFI